MPNETVMLWAASGLFAFIFATVGIVWKLLRDEAKSHADQIKEKADADDLKEMEDRFKSELVSVRETNEKLVGKLEVRHDRELEQMSSRLTEQIRTTEANILAQIKIMFETLRKD